MIMQCCMVIFNVLLTEILFKIYGDMASDLRPEVINTVINSACSGARRSMISFISIEDELPE